MADSTTQWERCRGGSAEAERVRFEQLGKDIMRVQAKLEAKSGAIRIDRAFHAKPLLAVDNARFEIVADLAPDLRQGFVKAGASYPTIVRLSNASGIHQSDHERDLRGVAIRIRVADDEIHDLLMTSFPVPHARDADQFVAFADAMAGNRVIGIAGLMFKVGPREAVRMLRNVLEGAKRQVSSLALECFWSRGALLWGGAGPVRYFIRPAPGVEAGHVGTDAGANYLREEIAERLADGEAVYEFCIQRFIDEKTAPVEDAATEWAERSAPPIVVARLVIPQQDVLTPEAAETARKEVYKSSAARRSGLRFHNEPPLRNRLSTRALVALFKGVNRLWPWHTLPLTLSLLNLSLLRHELREKNLIDTETREAPPTAEPMPTLIPEDVRRFGTSKGDRNDLSAPEMGAKGATFGRNLKPRYLPDLIDEPNPVTVSQRLLRREHFIPAATLNVLAASWIQFQVHDWVAHGEKDIRVPMPDSGTWRNTVDGSDEPEMRIAGDIAQAEADPAAGPAGAGLRQHGVPLVGRVGSLRRRRQAGRETQGTDGPYQARR